MKDLPCPHTTKDRYYGQVMAVNPGYLSFLVFVVFVILLSTGWKEVLLRETPLPAILLFMVAWIPASSAEIRLPGLGVNGFAVLLACFAAAGIYGMPGGLKRVSAVGAILFFGCFDFFLGEFWRWIPSASIPHPEFYASLVAAASSLLFFRRSREQLTVISAALLVANVMQQWAHAHWLEPYVGGARFRDHWWLTAGTALVLSSASAWALAKGKLAAGRWTLAWKGRRF